MSERKGKTCSPFEKVAGRISSFFAGTTPSEIRHYPLMESEAQTIIEAARARQAEPVVTVDRDQLARAIHNAGNPSRVAEEMWGDPVWREAAYRQADAAIRLTAALSTGE
jgi:hypothetical protein